MAYSVTASVKQELAKPSGAEPINMFILNASISGTDYKYYANYNQDVYGYQLDSDGEFTVATQLYTGLPVSFSPVNTGVSGEISDISVQIPNVDRVVESFIQTQNYLRGKDIHFVTTFAKFLPSGDSSKHIGSTPDKNAVLKEKLFIDTTMSDDSAVTFVCRPKFTIKHIQLPNRTFGRECAWAYGNRYLATECDPLASVNSASFPTCDGTIGNCRARNNLKRFGGFVSIPRKGITIV